MDTAIYSIIGIAAILLGAALLVVWSRRDIHILRGTSTIMALVATLIAAGIIGGTLGNAVPLIGGVTAPTGDMSVLSVKAVEGKGIYLTMDLPGAPKLFWLPWNTKTAEKLQDMIGDPGNAGVIANVPPFEWSWDVHPPSFQPIPQPKWMPDKPGEPDGPPDTKPQAPHFSA